MPPPQTRYCRNATEVARLLCQSVKPRAIEAVVEWMQREDWPKKASNGKKVVGWTHAALLAWREKTTPEFAQKKALAAIYDPEKQLKPSDLKIAQTMGGGGQGGAGTVEADLHYPKSVVGQRVIAELIARRFKIECVQQYIHNWRRMKGVKGNVPFPAPSATGNRYDVAACFAWVETYIMPERNGNGQTPDMFGMTAALKHREMEKKIEIMDLEIGAQKGKLIDRAVAERTAMGVIQTLWNLVVNQDEVELVAFLGEELRTTGLPVEVVTVILEKVRTRTRAMTDRRAAAFDTAMREGLKEEVGGEE